MKRFLMIPAALALANCAALPAALSTIGGLSQAVSVNQDKVLVPAAQALIVADNAYQGATAVATAAINTCAAAKFSGPCAGLKDRLPQIKALSDKAESLLLAAHNGQNVAENAAQVMNLVGTIQSLSGV